MSPAVPCPAPALDLDAVSDYVPAPDDGLALDYGPAPDSDAARNYAKVPSPAPDPASVPDLASALDPASVPDQASVPDAVGAQVLAATDPWADDPAGGPVSSATYWRRRLVALAVGIAVLTVLAWAVTGVLHGSGASQPTGPGARPSATPGGTHGDKDGTRPGQRNAHRTSLGGHAALGGSARSSAPGQARTTSTGTARRGRGTLSGIVDVLTMSGARRHASTTARRTPPHRSAARTPEHRATRPAAAPPVPACARGDVVLSLRSPRPVYQRGRWPLFGVEAVSTGNRPCLFNMGTRFATVVVSSGRARIWGSGDCVRGTGSQMVTLSRGQPAVRWIYWDRATSYPGCRAPRRPAPRGSYTAIAFDGQLSSQVMVFMLGRPGAAHP